MDCVGLSRADRLHAVIEPELLVTGQDLSRRMHSPRGSWSRIGRESRILLDLSVKYCWDFSSQSKIPIGRQLSAICIERQPVAPVGSVAPVSGGFQNRRSFIHFIEHVCEKSPRF